MWGCFQAETGGDDDGDTLKDIHEAEAVGALKDIDEADAGALKVIDEADAGAVQDIDDDADALKDIDNDAGALKTDATDVRLGQEVLKNLQCAALHLVKCNELDVNQFINVYEVGLIRYILYQLKYVCRRLLHLEYYIKP